MAETGGAVEVVLGIVLSGVDHLTGLPVSFASLQGRLHHVEFEAPAEAAAEKGGVDVDLLGLQAGNLAGHFQHPALVLGRHPDLAAIFGDRSGAVHRLHRYMAEIGTW